MVERRYPDLVGLRELAELAKGVSWHSPVSIEYRMAMDPATAIALIDRLVAAEATPSRDHPHTEGRS